MVHWEKEFEWGIFNGGISRGHFSVTAGFICIIFWIELQSALGGSPYPDIVGRKFGIVGDNETIAVCLFDSLCFLYVLYSHDSLPAYVLDGNCRNHPW
jgi:hypothetical protein